MFLTRASLLVLVVAFVSLVLCGGESKNDRMYDLISLMYDLGKHVDSLTDSIQKIYHMEEETAEHMSKIEDTVVEIEQNEGDMAKKVGNIETKMAKT